MSIGICVKVGDAVFISRRFFVAERRATALGTKSRVAALGDQASPTLCCDRNKPFRWITSDKKYENNALRNESFAGHG